MSTKPGAPNLLEPEFRQGGISFKARRRPNIVAIQPRLTNG
jgi:hypothetical protein